MTFDVPRPRPPEPPPPPPRPRAAYAPALFVLGAMIGLLSVMGRITQELESSLITSLGTLGRGRLIGSSGGNPSALPPMIHGLGTPEQRLVLVGFVISAGLIAAAAYAWHSGGQPSTEAARILTSLATWVAGLLALCAAATLLAGDPTVRLVVLTGAGTLAMLTYTRLVLLLAAFSLPRE